MRMRLGTPFFTYWRRNLEELDFERTTLYEERGLEPSKEGKEGLFLHDA